MGEIQELQAKPVVEFQCGFHTTWSGQYFGPMSRRSREGLIDNGNFICLLSKLLALIQTALLEPDDNVSSEDYTSIVEGRSERRNERSVI